jgi:hypothetical protein
VECDVEAVASQQLNTAKFRAEPLVSAPNRIYHRGTE